MDGTGREGTANDAKGRDFREPLNLENHDLEPSWKSRCELLAVGIEKDRPAVRYATMPRVAAVKGEDKTESSSVIVPVPVMTGTHFHGLDEKGRVIIPAKLRPGLTERFWMMLDEKDNVAMYDFQTGLDVLEYCERQMADNPSDEFIAAAVERITGAAEQVQVENDSWRVAVSDILRLYAGIEKEVVSVGVLNKAVMWSRERWEVAQQERESPEVRRAQAGMLRAAASQVKKPGKTQDAEREIEQTEEMAANAIGTVATGTAGNGTTGAGAAAASTGNGGRSSRVLTLSNIGR
jgi:MraZ protein